MQGIEVIVLAAVVVLAAGALALWHRRPAREAEPAEPPRALVRLLTTEEDLREAALRAARFDEIAAASLEARARRYHALAQSTTHSVRALHPELRSNATDGPPRAA